MKLRLCGYKLVNYKEHWLWVKDLGELALNDFSHLFQQYWQLERDKFIRVSFSGVVASIMLTQFLVCTNKRVWQCY